MLEKAKQKAMLNSMKVGVVVGALDSMTLATIFTLFLKDFLHQFLEQTGKYFLFPLAAAASLISAVLAWRQAYLDRKTRSIGRALVETGAALAITTVVIGSLVAASIFAAIAPVVFATVLGLKTFYHAASALYYFLQGDYGLAKANAVATLAGVFATVAVVGVMLLGKTALAVAGITAGVIGTVYAVYNGVKLFKAKEDKVVNTQEKAPFVAPVRVYKNQKSYTPTFNMNKHEVEYAKHKDSTLFGNSKVVPVSVYRKQQEYYKRNTI